MERMNLDLFNITVLDFYYVDITDEGVIYDDVVFHIESLSQYNGRCVEVTNDWKVSIYDNEAAEKELKFLMIENDEFRTKLYDKYPLK